MLPQLLLISFLLFLLATTFLAMSSFHNYSVTRRVEWIRARLAARAAVQEALLQLSDDATWAGVVEGTTRGARYQLDFRDSVNNLAGASPMPGYAGRQVPPYSALLVGHGEGAGQARATVLALVRFRPFPYGLAASNGISARARLTVLGAGSLDEVRAGRLDRPAGILLPASGSNLSSGANSLVTGSVLLASGQPALGPNADIRQGVRLGATPAMVPDLELGHYDDRNFEGLTEVLPGNHPYLTLEGPVRVDGSLTAAGARLENAYLFVNGNLTIHGQLTGTGSIYVQGATSLRGNQSLVGGTSIAIFSQGPLVVSGASFYQGLLYSHDSVRTGAGMNVVGAVIAQGPSGLAQGGRLELGANSTVTYVPELANMGAAGAASSELRVVYWSDL